MEAYRYTSSKPNRILPREPQGQQTSSSQGSKQTNMAQSSLSIEISHSPSNLSPVPSSPSYSVASTSHPPPSHLLLPLPPTPPIRVHAVLSKTDLEASHVAYTELLTCAKAYRQALATLSTTASVFGASLESCARLKEARSEALHTGGSVTHSFTANGFSTADNLMATSGLHHLIANHQQILSECVYRSFEVPLLDELDHWRRNIEEEEVTYQREVKGLSQDIRKMEKDGLKLHRQKKRDIGRFRGHLVALTNKLDGLTTLHGEHARRLLRDSQETSSRIVEAGSSLVKAELDIFEAIARKGWAGGGLDELLVKGKDLFAANEEEIHGSNDTGTSTLFSILPHKSILPDSSSPSPEDPTKRADSLLDDVDRCRSSLAGAVSARDPDVTSIFSERNTNTVGLLNRSRGARFFSPPPSLDRVSDDPLSPNKHVVSQFHNVEENAGQVPVSAENEPAKDHLPMDVEEDNRGREMRRGSVDDGDRSDDNPHNILNEQQAQI